MIRPGGTTEARQRGRIRSRIHNHRLVKDQDPRVARDLFVLLGLLVVLALPAIWGITQRDRFVRTGYEIEKLRDELTKLGKEQQRLVIERAGAEAAGKVAHRAFEDLGLVEGALGRRVLVTGTRPGVPRRGPLVRDPAGAPQEAGLLRSDASRPDPARPAEADFAAGGVPALISGIAPAGGNR